MKSLLRIALLWIVVGFGVSILCSQDSIVAKRSASFTSDIAPILSKNCQPCHFPGGKVFAKLPFENYFTVKKLGLKLNTRFKKEEQQTLVKSWVKAGSPKE